MPGLIGTTIENALFDHYLGGPDLARPASVKAKLFTSPPTNFLTGTGGTEVSGGSYAAVSITNNTTNFPNSSNRAKTNGAAINFPTPTAGWGNVTGIRLDDASDNYIAFSFLDNGATVANCSTTNGSTTVTTSGTFTNNVVVGCLVTGAGIPSNTVVTAVNSATSITLSQAATATATVSLSFSGFKTINTGDPVSIPASSLSFSRPSTVA